MSRPARRYLGRDLGVVLGSAVPSNSSRQVTPEHYVPVAMGQRTSPVVVDLGCGAGHSRAAFVRVNSSVHWIGIDIPRSHEVSQRGLSDGRFLSYDGVRLPLRDRSIDAVFSRQVFMHVEHPHDLLREIERVLRPGGYFFGSVSSLEPYQSRSRWNFTPYGWRDALDGAGMTLIEIRPGIDAITLIARRALRRRWDRWFASEAPLNRTIGGVGRLMGWDHHAINCAKLLLCGQYSFLAQQGKSERE